MTPRHDSEQPGSEFDIGADPPENQRDWATPDDGVASPAAGENAENSGDSAAPSHPERAVLDTRQRGWFWHWNTVVTQYAPLIGLKGSGLLNSYTVWTDRREESPRRGYAFPSQQSESDFYGEERSELITINKLLIALDLIEVRKEMIERADERGRRWRVPHNLYRVRDRPNGISLRVTDVICVAELASRDDAVFRYARRVFSPRFRPIDRDNVWHAILEELADHPLWVGLRERARAIEERASARSRAGHQSRGRQETAASESMPLTTGQSGQEVLPGSEHSGLDGAGETAVVAVANSALGQSGTDAAPSNDGSAMDVDASNTGSAGVARPAAAQDNRGSSGSVEPSNTTYDQSPFTTTTTTTTRDASKTEFRRGHVTAPDNAVTGVCVTDERRSRGNRAPQVVGAGGGGGDGGDDGESEAAGVVDDAPRGGQERGGDADTDATDGEGGTRRGTVDDTDGAWRGRRAAPAGSVAFAVDMDRQEARGVAGNDADRNRNGPASSEGDGERGMAGAGSGGGPLVDPDPLVVSTFEAANDRRATPLERLLLAELERDADPPARAAGSSGAAWVVAALREAVGSGSTFVAPKRVREIIGRWSGESARVRNGAQPPEARASEPGRRAAPTAPAEINGAASFGDSAIPAGAPDVRLPRGASGKTVWSATLADLAASLDRETFERLLVGSAITRYWRGTVEIQAPSPAAADKLSAEYRALVERHLNARLSSPVAARFHAVAPDEPIDDGRASEATYPRPDDGTASVEPIVVSRADFEIGRQIWRSLLADLAPFLPSADLDRISGAVLLGEDRSGALLLGVPTALAARLIETRYRREVERSLAALVGRETRARVVVRGAWTLREEPAGDDPP